MVIIFDVTIFSGLFSWKTTLAGTKPGKLLFLKNREEKASRQTLVINLDRAPLPRDRVVFCR